MIILPRRPFVLLSSFVVVLGLGAFGSASVLFAAPSNAASCTDSWVGPTTGVSSWFDAANWSNGVPDYQTPPPNANGHVCIDLDGTYTVDLGASATVNSIQLGGASGTQTLKVDGSAASVRLDLTEASSVSAHGVLALNPTSIGTVDLSAGVYTGGGGSLSVASGGVFSTSGASDAALAYLDIPITNAAGATMSFGAPVTAQRFNALITNSGEVTVASGAELSLTSGASFTNAAGTLAVTGTFTEADGTYTASGGTETGQPVTLTGGTLADSAGTGAFDITGSSTLYGDIPTGQVVTVDGAVDNIFLTVPGDSTVHGTLALHPADGFAGVTGNSGAGSLSVASGGVFSTSGASDAPLAYLDIPITNTAGATMSLSAPNTVLRFGAQASNSGAVTVHDGGHLDMSGTTLTNTATSTVGVTVNATNATVSGISGTVTAAGTLAVTTIGSPAVGSDVVPLTGPVSGTFSHFSFGTHAYTVSYPQGTVQLTTARAFTLTPTRFSPRANIPTGPVQVATIGKAGTGSYSATVDFGDGRPARTATVSGSGAVRTVTAPSHTYAAVGSFVVTTSVSNGNGTKRRASTTVTVRAPARPRVTAVAPSAGPAAGGQTVTIRGTDLTHASKVAFGGTAATRVVVVSSTKITVRTPAHALGTVNVHVTTPGGTSAATAADRYRYARRPSITAVAPKSGHKAGGQTVTIRGTGLTDASKVAFGGTAATRVVVVSSTKITVRTPEHALGTVNVHVTTPAGTSATTTADRFKFV